MIQPPRLLLSKLTSRDTGIFADKYHVASSGSAVCVNGAALRWQLEWMGRLMFLVNAANNGITESGMHYPKYKWSRNINLPASRTMGLSAHLSSCFPR